MKVSGATKEGERRGEQEERRKPTTVLDALHHKLHHTCCWFLIVLFTLLFILPHSVHSQQSASLHVPLFATNRSLSLRQNICDRAKKYDNELRDDLDLRCALEGMQLNVAAGNGIYFLYQNGTINEEYPGLMAVLMDEIAKRGRFTWRDSFAVYDGPTGNHTWSEMLLFLTNFFDLSVDWWVETLPRLKLGVEFPEGWYDASIILVTAEENKGNEKVINLWGWLLPFEADVWIMILFTLIWSGVVYMFLEYLAFPRQYTGRGATESFGNDIFLSFLLFTQHFQFNPKTPASRILATSMAFWALLISSAYTANLASFFVEETNQKYEISSIEDAIRLGRPICVWDTSPAANYVQETYPAGTYVKLKMNEDSKLYHSLNDGVCAAAVTLATSFQDYSRTREINADCRLHKTGNILKPSWAGFAAKSDAGRKCTSLIHDVVNLHMLEMHADGFLGRAWEEHFARRQDHFCDGSNQANKQQSQRRSIQEMGGTFVVHFTVSCLAIAVAVFTKIWKVYKKRKNLTIVTTSVTQSGDFEKEGLDILGPLPNGNSGAISKADLASSGSTTAGSTTAPARTLLQDFWEETPSMRMKGSMHLAPRREASIGSGMGNLQLLELLRGEFQRQQDQLELKWQHQQHQSEQRVQYQLAAVMERKMLLQEQRMQDQFSSMMDLLRRTNNENLKGGDGKLNDWSMPTSVAEGNKSQVERKPGTANRGHRAQQIQQLLYPHERQELRGATAEYFKDEDCFGLPTGKSIDEQKPVGDHGIRVSAMGLG